MNLDSLLGLPRSGVVILKKGDRALVSYTTSMGAELENLYNQFRGKIGLTMEIVSAEADIETLKLHTEYYRNLYHTVLRHRTVNPYGRRVIAYSVRITPNGDFKYVDVELVTARGDSKVVGRFKNIQKAKEFIEISYGSDNPFRLPVYAWNSDTKEFLLEQQKKMLDIR